MDAAEQKEESKNVLQEDKEWGMGWRGKDVRNHDKDVSEKGRREGSCAGVCGGGSGEEEGFHAQGDGSKANDWEEGRATKPAVVG